MNETYPAALAVGTELKSQVATYRITQVLGQGGCGITYKAEIPSIGTRHTYFAIKEFFIKDGNARRGNQVVVLPDKEAVVQSMKERYWREVERLSKYDHPHIVKVADRIEANNTLYYVMDFLPGGSLNAFKQPMDEKRLARYIIQVAEALQYLHSRRVNHLDVKPENIVLDEQDNAILIDFGISQGYTASGERTTVFSTRGISKGYSAPEYGKENSFSPALDVYSLGATLYRLVTGQLPPDIQDVKQLTFPAPVSSRMKSIIKQAMHHRVDKRSSLKELIRFLNKIWMSKSRQSNDTSETKDSKWEVIKSFVMELYNLRHDQDIKDEMKLYLGLLGMHCVFFICTFMEDDLTAIWSHIVVLSISCVVWFTAKDLWDLYLHRYLFNNRLIILSNTDRAYFVWSCIMLIGYILIYFITFASLIHLYNRYLH